jgi:hypothetical protein
MLFVDGFLRRIVRDQIFGCLLDGAIGIEAIAEKFAESLGIYERHS